MNNGSVHLEHLVQPRKCPSSLPFASSFSKSRFFASNFGEERTPFSELCNWCKTGEGKLWLQPRIRRKIVLVEEYLSSDGVREPEGRGDRQDIEIVGRVRDIGIDTRHHDRD